MHESMGRGEVGGIRREEVRDSYCMSGKVLDAYLCSVFLHYFAFLHPFFTR